MTSKCAVCTALQTNKYVIRRGARWTVALATDQYWLGRSYVTLHSHKESLSDLNTEDWREYIEIVRMYEKKVREEFGADLFNWSCLMNDAFKREPFQSPHVHWHVRPRYSQIQEIGSMKFSDSELGQHYRTRYDGRKDMIVPDEIMKIIHEKLEF